MKFPRNPLASIMFDYRGREEYVHLNIESEEIDMAPCKVCRRLVDAKDAINIGPYERYHPACAPKESL